MNYLAHAYLSCDNELLLLGNMITDLCRTSDIAEIKDEEVLKGVKLHQAIDSFTDQHKQVKRSNKKFHKRHGKYAPVLTDIYYDYLLVENWKSYSGQALEEFIHDTNILLQKNLALVPTRIRSRLENMLKKDFLAMSTTEENLLKSLEYMDRRTSFPSIFRESLEDYKLHHTELNVEFNRFFPDLIHLAETECDC